MNIKHISLALIASLGLSMAPIVGQAQEESEKDKGGIASYAEPNFFRPYDKRGLNMFETTKEDMNKEYTGRRFSIGAGFSLQFQSLKHSSDALGTGNLEVNEMPALAPGFSLPQANLYIDAQLADGIRLHLANYMASKHHNEFWVKGGYLQVDKIPFRGAFWDQLSEIVTIKAGHMEINYGDAHFRRPDGGHTSYSPFLEGNIMDAFATEIAAEVYAQKNNWIGMIGVSNGMIQGHTLDAAAVGPAGEEIDKRSPSIYAKVGWDKTFDDDMRLRLTGSVYHNSGTKGTGLTLYSGDRTGSNYNLVMEQWNQGGARKGNAAMYASGRFNPGMNRQLTALMFNAFAKVEGFEFFGTAEFANGRGNFDADDRSTNQFAAEGIYRFGTNENLFVGLRYNIVNSNVLIDHNTVTGGAPDRQNEDVKVDRFSVGAGWFLTKNILLKGEYVNQTYTDFPNMDYRHNGKFNGVVLQAAISF